MTLEETDKIDGAAIDEDGTLILLLTDALGWDDEYDHLMLLQEKLNNYTAFFESRQYEEIFPGKQVSGCQFRIRFIGSITQTCYDFLDAAAAQLGEELEIEFDIGTGDDGNED